MIEIKLDEVINLLLAFKYYYKLTKFLKINFFKNLY